MNIFASVPKEINCTVIRWAFATFILMIGEPSLLDAIIGWLSH